ncbi:MAG: methionine--tRNA ligase [Candidatus Eremiobacterota bacterium]
MPRRILVGVAWPYANGPLHLGHLAGCYLPADIFARYHRMAGDEVLMVSGSDQHGTPVTVRAEAEGVSPGEVAERFHRSFLDTFARLGVRWELFTRTGTDNHREVVQDLFRKLHAKGYLYPATQTMLYDPEQQRFLPDRFVEGTCPHCGSTQARGDQCDACGRTLDATELIEPRSKLSGARPVPRDTQHLFFKWSAFDAKLLDYVKDKAHWRPNVINFTRRYLTEGLKDSAVTRDLAWGIPCPIQGFEDKCIYVWFEAVVGYLSASIEWAARSGDPEAWKRWWMDPSAQSFYFIGKDNIPFHTIRWPAVLMAVEEGHNLPYDVPANEFLGLEGRQFSTSRNWAVWAPDFLDRYDPDPLRYFLTVNAPETGDSDFSWHEFLRKNNDELVAAWGNLVNRVTSFTARNYERKVPPSRPNPEDEAILQTARDTFPAAAELLERCSFKAALLRIMETVREGNRYLDTQEPWKTIKVDRERAGTALATSLRFIAALKVLLTPFLPNTCRLLHGMLNLPGDAEAGPWAPPDLPDGHPLNEPHPLFKKLDKGIIDDEFQRLGAQPA